jgi:hypothetical protein
MAILGNLLGKFFAKKEQKPVQKPVQKTTPVNKTALIQQATGLNRPVTSQQSFNRTLQTPSSVVEQTVSGGAAKGILGALEATSGRPVAAAAEQVRPGFTSGILDKLKPTMSVYGRTANLPGFIQPISPIQVQAQNATLSAPKKFSVLDKLKQTGGAFKQEYSSAFQLKPSKFLSPEEELVTSMVTPVPGAAIIKGARVLSNLRKGTKTIDAVEDVAKSIPPKNVLPEVAPIRPSVESPVVPQIRQELDLMAIKNTPSVQLNNRLDELAKELQTNINKDLDKEFGMIEDELIRRDDQAIRSAPLSDMDKTIASMDLDRREARELRSIAAKYQAVKQIPDEELIKDFSDALMGNPTTWSPDGIKLRESANALAERNIDLNIALEKVAKRFTDDGYDLATAKEVIAGYLKPIFGTKDSVGKGLPRIPDVQSSALVTQPKAKEVVLEAAVTPQKDIGWYTKWFSGPNRVIEQFFSPEKAAKFNKTIGASVSEGRLKKAEVKDAYKKDINDISTTYGVTKKNELDVALFAEKSITKADLIEKYGKEIADKLEGAAKAARKIYEKGIKELNRAEKAAGIPLTKPREDYVRHMYESGSTNKGGWADGLQTATPGSARSGAKTTGKSSESITKARTGESTPGGLIEGLREWTEQASTVIGFADTRVKINKLLAQMRKRKAVGGKKVSDRDLYPNMYNWLEGFARELEGKPRAVDDVSTFMRSSKLGSAIAGLDRRLKGSMILGNISSTYMNGANIPQITTFLGDGNAAKGANMFQKGQRMMFTDEGKALMNESGWIRERYSYKEDGGYYGKVWDNAKDNTTASLQIATGVLDELTTKGAYLARVTDNLKKGMSRREAIQDAEIFVEKMVGGRGIGEYPPALQTTLGKLFLPFTREVVNFGDIVFKDLPEQAKKGMMQFLVTSASLWGTIWLYNSVQEKIFGRKSLIDPIDMSADLVKEFSRPSKTPLVSRLTGRVLNEALGLTAFSSLFQQLLNTMSPTTKDEIFGKSRFEGGFILGKATALGFKAVDDITKFIKGEKTLADIAAGDLGAFFLQFVDAGSQIHKLLKTGNVLANDGIVTDRGGTEVGRIESTGDILKSIAGGPSASSSVVDYYNRAEDPSTFSFQRKEIEKEKSDSQTKKALEESYDLSQSNLPQFVEYVNSMPPSVKKEFEEKFMELVQEKERGSLDPVARKLKGSLPTEMKAQALIEYGQTIEMEQFLEDLARYKQQGLITESLEKELVPLLIKTFN